MCIDRRDMKVHTERARSRVNEAIIDNEKYLRSTSKVTALGILAKGVTTLREHRSPLFSPFEAPILAGSRFRDCVASRLVSRENAKVIWKD